MAGGEGVEVFVEKWVLDGFSAGVHLEVLARGTGLFPAAEALVYGSRC
jgi:hypothetical protein